MAGRSQLPVPASTFKKPVQPPMRAGRQSLAGPPTRGPLLASSSNLPAPLTNPRQSVYRAQPMPMSTTKRPAIPGKDQRDTRSPAFKTSTLQMLVQFLQAHDYPGDLSFKMLAAPPAREVQSVVKSLIYFLDPHYVWGKGGIKWEDELLPLLRGLKYPYTDGLTKATLQTPGSMPNMPHTLGLLHWLVNLCKVLPNQSLHRARRSPSLISGETRISIVKTRRCSKPRTSPSSSTTNSRLASSSSTTPAEHMSPS